MSDDTVVDTSPEACAVVCMLVSNPQGKFQTTGWQKRVNDLIRALRDERTSLQMERTRLRAEVDTLIAEIGRLHSQLTAATKRAETAERERDEADSAEILTLRKERNAAYNDGVEACADEIAALKSRALTAEASCAGMVRALEMAVMQLQHMQASGSWDAETLKRAIELTDSTARQALASIDGSKPEK